MSQFMVVGFFNHSKRTYQRFVCQSSCDWWSPCGRKTPKKTETLSLINNCITFIIFGAWSGVWTHGLSGCLCRGKNCWSQILLRWSKILQYFGNVGTIWQLYRLLLKLQKWWTTMDSKMSSSPDTLLVVLIGFASLALSMISEFTFLGVPNLAWSSRFWQCEQNFLNYLVILLWSSIPSPLVQQVF